MFGAGVASVRDGSEVSVFFADCGLLANAKLSEAVGYMMMS